jgi:hypothetical protein
MWLVGALAGVLVAVALSVFVIALVSVNSPPDQPAQKAKGKRPGPGPAEDSSPLPGESAEAFGRLAMRVLIIAFAVAYVVLVILLLAWVARDARNRGVDGGAVWVFIILLTGVVGLIVYVAARPHGMLTSCGVCRNKRLVHAKLCPHCGNA